MVRLLVDSFFPPPPPWYYPQLLSRSHDTIEHIELHSGRWSIGGVYLRDALAHCTRVRHLTLRAESYGNARIIAACPRLLTLSLAEAPTAEEMAALQAPLRVLEVADRNNSSLEQCVARAWERLRLIIHDAPDLGTICLNYLGEPLQGETEPYHALLTMCKERRIHLSIVPAPRIM